MKKRTVSVYAFCFLLFLACSFLLSPASNAQSTAGNFAYSLTTAGKTSAGVFTPDGTLLKTLWSNVAQSAGKHTGFWDGTDNEGNRVPDGKYEVRVLSSQVKYTWEGVIGNTSDKNTGPTVWYNDGFCTGLALGGNNIYVSFGYDEGSSGMYKFNMANPQSRSKIGWGGVGVAGPGEFHYVASDGKYVYWGGDDPSANVTIRPWTYISTSYYIHATRVSDDTEVAFPNGTPYKPVSDNVTLSTIDLITKNRDGAISGLAVQQTGPYLFVSHARLNELHVADKTSGALVRVIPMTKPEGLATDGDNNLWVIDHNGGAPQVEKYTVNADGTLALAASIQNLSSPLAVAVSPDKKTVLIADGGDSAQLKAYSNAAAPAPLWTYGIKGGYANGVDVTDDKFFFSSQSEWEQQPYATAFGERLERTFLLYQPDGSFWVGDTGNFRIQHYSAERKLIDRVMKFPMLYNVSTIANEPTRLLARSLEFKIDYSKPIAPNNGSWTLVKNWAWNGYSFWKNPVTLPNGRTYALVRNMTETSDREEVIEFSPTGIRHTGILIGWDGAGGTASYSYTFWYLYPDGSLRAVFAGRWPDGTEHPGLTWRMQKLIGFDDANNPKWAPPVDVVSSPPLAENDPSAGQTPAPWEVTTTGIAAAFEGALGLGYHLGGIDTKTGKWVFKAAPATGRGHYGSFPIDDAFDTGNGVTASTGGTIFATGRNFIYTYNGEGWSGGETAMFVHYYDDGLKVGQFGNTWSFIYSAGKVDVSDEPGVAGNGVNPGNCSLVTMPNGTVYIYHGDEGFHGGIHRWRIDGLNTVKEQKIPLTLSAALVKVPPSTAIDLHAGLPHATMQKQKDPAYGTEITDLFATVLQDNTNGWHRTPATDMPGWAVRTGFTVYQKDKSADVYAAYSLGAGKVATITRDIREAAAPAVASWQLDGWIRGNDLGGFCLTRGTPDDGKGNSGGQCLEVLDDAGKVIARMYPGEADATGKASLIGNGTAIYQTDRFNFLIMIVAKGLVQPPHYNISAQKGQVTFTFADNPPVTTGLCDPASHWDKPTTLRLYFWNGPQGGTYTNIDLIGTTFKTGK